MSEVTKKEAERLEAERVEAERAKAATHTSREAGRQDPRNLAHRPETHRVTGREVRENPKLLKGKHKEADPSKGQADALEGVIAAGQR